MSARLAFRLAAAGFALLAILVAALQARRPAPPTPSPQTAVQAAAPVDARLQRCQALGAAGAQDPECLRAWDAARTRFLGRARADR
ncbi:conjugative transfer region protein TrbK [Caulobacter rhizosphaerae]|uniref:Conjugative transfer region protein TrbK n=1 Tax=Caulobacter rhizosphaerae TaxID=2010972 RepID=A0ABU1MVM7_9CAUL|nr:putative entry exclusion protein TrbK-alt [Caulobacter rhizosphaerae]MDR6530243.1 conjugative transfer region protein TrbK [Caulobacter rhizosphaerae]